MPELVRGLDDSDPGVRRATAEALGEIGPAAHEAVPSLIKMLGDSDIRSRMAATFTLGKIGPAAVSALSEGIGPGTRRQTKRLAELPIWRWSRYAAKE